MPLPIIMEYFILGLIQGLTEFLPVSSSGHLVFLQEIFHMENRLLVTLSLHAGTLLALVLFFKKDIQDLFRDSWGSLKARKKGTEKKEAAPRIIVYIFIITLITGIIGLGGKDFFENLFFRPRWVAIMLMITALILFSTRKFMKGERKFSALNIRDAVIMGLAQGISLIPGISRSGITIASLLWRGVDREAAFRLSFLASIPAILGALILEFSKLPGLSSSPNWGYLLFGLISAFVSGWIALVVLRKIIRRAQFPLFGYYCLAIALLGWLYFA